VKGRPVGCVVVLYAFWNCVWNGGGDRVGSDKFFGMLRLWMGSSKFMKLHLDCKRDIQIFVFD